MTGIFYLRRTFMRAKHGKCCARFRILKDTERKWMSDRRRSGEPQTDSASLLNTRERIENRLSMIRRERMELQRLVGTLTTVNEELSHRLDAIIEGQQKDQEELMEMIRQSGIGQEEIKSKLGL